MAPSSPAWLVRLNVWVSRAKRSRRKTEERSASQPEWMNEMLDTVVNKLRSYRKYQETYRELSRLSTRELADLGISRGEISNVARKATL